MSGFVLTAVTSGGRAEIDWISDGVGVLFPEAHERLRAGLRPGERVIESFARRLRDADADVRSAAAVAWEEWESTHVSLDPGFRPGPMFDDDRVRENFVTLVTHYWANDCFLPAGRSVLDRVEELRDIPAVLIHGRHDVSSPVATAWRLHRSWPASRLHIVETEGHGGPEEMELTASAIDAFLAAQ